MPHSTPFFKKETKEFVTTRYSKSSSVLDLGTGCGTYADLLADHFDHKIDGVEGFAPYIDMFGLKEKYGDLYHLNVTDFGFDWYDLVIFGDVLEHLEEKAAIDLVHYLYPRCRDLIIAVPFRSEQGVHYDNELEIHRQTTITNESFLRTYSGFRPLCLREDYGVYIKDTEENSRLSIVYDEWWNKAKLSWEDMAKEEFLPQSTGVSVFEDDNTKETLAHEKIFSSIYDTRGFGGTESRSGVGSDFEHTFVVRRWLKKIISQYNIERLIDIPCGDFNWMSDVTPHLKSYVGGDIVRQCVEDNRNKRDDANVTFIHIDLMNDVLPFGDALVLRDILGHYSVEDGRTILANVLKSDSKYLISTTWYNVNDPEYFKKHDNRGADSTGRFYPINLMSRPFNFPEPDDYVEEAIMVDGHDTGNRKVLAIWLMDRIKHPFNYPEQKPKVIPKPSKTTFVTGLWNIGRVGRDFDHYIDHFNRLLDMAANLFIYVPAELEHLVWKKRSRHNTFVKVYELSDVKEMMSPFCDKIEKIRTNPEWFNQTGENGWLKGSPQAANEWYNPVVMAKMPMLHSASCWNPFASDKFIWIDGGLTHTVWEQYLCDPSFVEKMEAHLDPFLFLSYPYDTHTEIHGFPKVGMNKYAQTDVRYVCRGGLFGGTKAAVDEANAIYYTTLMNTLDEGFMGTEECIFTAMSYQKPEIFRRFELDYNGLIVKYAQALLDGSAELVPIPKGKQKLARALQNATKTKTDLYILTFNFNAQLNEILNSLKKSGWMDKANKVTVIDNSNDVDASIENERTCIRFGATHYPTGKNGGICGGRFIAAELFDKSDADYYMFFEDDMLFYTPEDGIAFCRNGFRTIVPNLFENLQKIMQREEFDFLKLSFTEVYMDNNLQVSWYNVPQSVRTLHWPDYDKLPITGLDYNCPRTRLDAIDSVEGLSYVSGDIYYANWPMIMSKEGNRRVFLTTTWANPFEQTWMSYVFQEQLKGEIRGAVLLASPIRHNRTSHYAPEVRREN